MEKIIITFPDGNKREYDAGITAEKVAQTISISLSKKAISADLDGDHWDLQWPIYKDAELSINTLKNKERAIELVRHDLAHIMARAVQEIWPKVKVTIGPVINHGWYYDFDHEEPFTPEDLGKIEKKMREIINLRDVVRTELWDRKKAVEYYTAKKEPYKIELIDAIPENDNIRMYWHGNWQDLCRGPHLQNTAQVPADAFKLMSVAGAYWRGDSNRQMLQRIYGVAFLNKENLREHLNMLEEAAKRDHRKLGKEMDLFHMQEEAPGQIFWHPNGWKIYTLLQDYMRRQQEAGGY
ncbi:MAG: TGS domain-containing protein, partial [Rhodobacteraceae bacterium]|nr:TGS domain-containing protein [Paracoccaceae bacterium]